MKNRAYNQYCGLAYALEIVGERWTLLAIRELVPGPRRFKDLLDGLPGISTNLLAERLRNLEQQGIIQRRVLPPPAASSVYELTECGRSLEASLLELGKWGRQFVPATAEGTTILRLGSYALTFKTLFRPDQALDITETYQLHVAEETLQVHIDHGRIEVEQGESRDPSIVITCDIATLLGLMFAEIEPQGAIDDGRLHITGDHSALDRFLHVCGMADIDHTPDQIETVPV